MRVNGGRLVAAVAAAVELVEALDPVEPGVRCPHLRAGERPDLRGGQWQRLDLLGRGAVPQQPGWGVDGDPGEQGRQVRQVVVDRRRRHRRRGAVPAGGAFGGQVVPPGGDLARGHSGDPVVPEPDGEPDGESLKVPLDLRGHLVGPDASYREVEVPLRPRGKAVAGLAGTPVKIDYLSFSDFAVI